MSPSKSQSSKRRKRPNCLCPSLVKGSYETAVQMIHGLPAEKFPPLEARAAVRGMSVVRLPLFCIIATQNEARRVRLGDKLAVPILHFTLNVADVLPSIGHLRLCTQRRLPDRTGKIDAETNRRERFFWRQGGSKSHAHSSVCQIAHNTAVKRAHGIGVLRPRFHEADCMSITDSLHAETNEPGDR